MLSQNELNQISAWMQEPGNMEKLTPIEATYLSLEFLKYQEKIAPIIIGAMARDTKPQTFIFRIGGDNHDRPEDAGN